MGVLWTTQIILPRVISAVIDDTCMLYIISSSASPNHAKNEFILKTKLRKLRISLTNARLLVRKVNEIFVHKFLMSSCSKRRKFYEMK